MPASNTFQMEIQVPLNSKLGDILYTPPPVECFTPPPPPPSKREGRRSRSDPLAKSEHSKSPKPDDLRRSRHGKKRGELRNSNHHSRKNKDGGRDKKRTNSPHHATEIVEQALNTIRRSSSAGDMDYTRERPRKEGKGHKNSAWSQDNGKNARPRSHRGLVRLKLQDFESDLLREFQRPHNSSVVRSSSSGLNGTPRQPDAAAMHATTRSLDQKIAGLRKAEAAKKKAKRRLSPKPRTILRSSSAEVEKELNGETTVVARPKLPSRSNSLSDVTELLANEARRRNNRGRRPSFEDDGSEVCRKSGRRATLGLEESNDAKQETSGDATEPSSKLSCRRAQRAEARNKALALLKKEYEQIQEEKGKNEEKCLRDEISAVEARLRNVESEKNQYLANMRSHFEQEKQDLLASTVKKTQELLVTSFDQDLSWKVLEVEQEKMELESEHKSLATEIKRIDGEMSRLEEENELLVVTNAEIQKKITSITKFISAKEEEQQKLINAESSLEEIVAGAQALMIEPAAKEIYRGCVYRCAAAVKDREVRSVFEETMGLIERCESELGCEVLNVDDCFSRQQQQQQPQKQPLNLDSFFRDHLQTLAEETEEDLDAEATTVCDDGSTVAQVEAFAEQAKEEYNLFQCSISNLCNHTQISTLFANKDMLMSIFRFLDNDNSGTIDPEEFRVGVELLNKRLPLDAKFSSPDELFRALDNDGNGEISLTEFEQIVAERENQLHNRSLSTF